MLDMSYVEGRGETKVYDVPLEPLKEGQRIQSDLICFWTPHKFSPLSAGGGEKKCTKKALKVWDTREGHWVGPLLGIGPLQAPKDPLKGLYNPHIRSEMLKNAKKTP